MAASTSTGQRRELAVPLAVKVVWVAVAVGLILARMIWTRLNVDAVSLGLLLIAGLPWLSSLVETAKLPFGIELKLRDLERAVETQETKVEGQRRALEKQQEVINQLVIYSMSDYIFGHLSCIYHGKRGGGEYLYRKNDNFDRDLRYLIDHGYIKYLNVNGMPDGTDLVRDAELTPVGEFLVEQRERLGAVQQAGG